MSTTFTTENLSFVFRPPLPLRPVAVPISVGDTARLDGGLGLHENFEHVHQKYHRFIRKVMNEF